MGSTKNQTASQINHCQLVLIASVSACTTSKLKSALEDGGVASLIIMADEANEGTFAEVCNEWVEIAQSKDVAALIVADTQITGRSEADGIFVETGMEDLDAALASFSPQKIVGCGGLKDRHRALQAGDKQPDFVFFGRLKGDIKAVPHKKNLALADWWSNLIETPCIVMGGNEIDSVIECAASGAEFVALNKAIFEHEDGPKKAVQLANKLLEENAPEFEEAK